MFLFYLHLNMNIFLPSVFVPPSSLFSLSSPIMRTAAAILLTLPLTAAFAPRTIPTASPLTLKATEEHDVIVVGSGIGGLSASALCARHSLRTICVEAHAVAGGAAHSFQRGPFVFDSGPSLLSGMGGRSTNPLRQLMEATGVQEEVRWAQYDGWMVSQFDRVLVAVKLKGQLHLIKH